PVVGERDGVVDGELDDLAALGPAVGGVGAVAVSARLEGPGAAVVMRAGGRGPAAALEDVIDVSAGRQAGCLGGGRVGNAAADRQVVLHGAVRGKEGVLVRKDERARRARGLLVARLAQLGKSVAVDAVADRLADRRVVDSGGAAVARVQV